MSVMEAYKQKGNHDCLLACICTLTQRSYEELWPTEFVQMVEEAKGTYGEVINEAFGIAGLTKDVDYWCIAITSFIPAYTVRDLLQGRRAIIQVRSLGNNDTGHFVYWSGEALYDPSPREPRYRRLSHIYPEYVRIFNEVAEKEWW